MPFIPCLTASTPGNPVERALHTVNSALVFWFFAFLITGPKNSHATTALLALSLVTLPATLRIWPRVWARSAPWLIGLSVYCVYQIAYRLIDGGLEARIDPPVRYLGAIPILFYLARYGFNINALWAGMVVGSLIGGVAGAQEVWLEGAQRAGAGHHPIAYGSVLALLSMILLYGATIFRETTWRVTLSAAAIVGLTGVLLSGTRGLYPALAVCMAFIGYRVLQRAGVSSKAMMLATACTVLAVAAAASRVPSVQQRFEETRGEYAQIRMGNLETSFGHRLQMWHAGLQLISQRPLFGLGPDVSRRAIAARDFMIEHRYNPAVLTAYDHLHNLYINETATLGLAGLAALAGLLYGAIGRTSHPLRGAIVIALAIILIEGLSETVLNHHRMMMAFVILVTLLRAQLANEAIAARNLTPSALASPSASDGAEGRIQAGSRAHP